MLKQNDLKNWREIAGPPIIHSAMDDVWMFYTPEGKAVISDSYDEAHAKYLLTKRTD